MKPLQYWSPQGFEISSYKNSLFERINKSYNGSGSDNTGKCVYTYNSLGFRGDESTKEGFKIMCIGDSNTEGVGVNDQETWPEQFSKLIPNGVNNNFGTGGRSNDFISRCLLTYYDMISPDLVLIMYTSPHRRDVFTSEGGIEPYIPTNSWGYLKDTEEGHKIQNLQTELQNDNMDFVNWYKNHLLIKYFLESKKCNWIWNGWMNIPKEYEDNTIRFDGDYGNFIDKSVDGAHPGPNHNKKYAHTLYNFICQNFSHYIFDLPKNKQNLI